MKTNETLLEQHECINSYEDVISLMKQAQTEILKEVVKRYRMQSHPIYEGQGNFKTIDDIVLELIKEIEL